MSTIEEFDNAPVGATATSPDGRKIYRREAKTLGGADWAHEAWDAALWTDADGLAHFGYTLGPAPSPAPTSAREALDLAWNLAHEVKEGQHIPEGTRLLDRSYRNDLSAYATLVDIIINARESFTIRTLEPLPDPEPDWLDAPAVLAHTDNDDTRRVWTARRDGQWASTSHTYTRHWRGLRDVSPLYSKEGKK